jgi:hypothetical protein
MLFFGQFFENIQYSTVNGQFSSMPLMGTPLALSIGR